MCVYKLDVLFLPFHSQFHRRFNKISQHKTIPLGCFLFIALCVGWSFGLEICIHEKNNQDMAKTPNRNIKNIIDWILKLEQLVTKQRRYILTLMHIMVLGPIDHDSYACGHVYECVFLVTFNQILLRFVVSGIGYSFNH